jgi:hypothetical protein
MILLQCQVTQPAGCCFCIIHGSLLWFFFKLLSFAIVHSIAEIPYFSVQNGNIFLLSEIVIYTRGAGVTMLDVISSWELLNLKWTNFQPSSAAKNTEWSPAKLDTTGDPFLRQAPRSGAWTVKWSSFYTNAYRTFTEGRKNLQEYLTWNHARIWTPHNRKGKYSF